MLHSALSSISTFTTNYLHPVPNEKGLASLNDQEILKAANALASMFSATDNKFTIPLPKLVVVGSQSSGKSSLICGLIGMNILPTGKQMVTRCPLHLQLLTHFEQKAWAEFGEYKNGKWYSTHKITVSLPDPTEEEVFRIQQQIKSATDKLAGGGKNITDKEIILKFYSPNVPNLSLIDLPGLTFVRTDKEQPADIEVHIRALIDKYALDKNSLLLTVVPARVDIEADVAMGLAKKYDPNGTRTIGVLTKVDLMNKDHDISNYLENDIPEDLRLSHGYFAINNVDRTSMYQSLQCEQAYFQTHTCYTNVALDCKKRMGRGRLGEYLSTVMMNIVKSNLPTIIAELTQKEKDLQENAAKLGMSLLSKTEGEKLTHCHMVISTLCKEFNKALEEKGGLNYGRYLKQHFIQYREDVKKIKYEFEETYVNNVIQNCNGNHMDFSVFSIEILEYCLQDKTQKIFSRLTEPSLVLVTSVIETLQGLLGVLLNSSEVSRFPNFVLYIKRELTSYLLTLTQVIQDQIRAIIQAQETYIWTDEVVFIENLKKIFQQTDSTQSQTIIITQLVNMYMNTVKNLLADQIPKTIMFFVIKQLEATIYQVLFNPLANQDLNMLLYEKNDVEQKRQTFAEQQNKITMAKKLLKM